MDPRLSRIRSCTLLLWIAFHKIYRDEGRGSGLSFTAGSILYTLSYQKVHMQDLAKINGVSKSTATDYIDNLEAKGYVRRAKDEADKRIIFIELTDKGKSWLVKNEGSIIEYLDRCTANLTDEELKSFTALFSKFMGVADIDSLQLYVENVMKMNIE